MESKTFDDQVKKIVSTNQIEKPNPVTLKEYWEKFKRVSDNGFIKMVDYILENSEYRRFPIIFDFVRARKAVLPPPNTYRQEETVDKGTQEEIHAWGDEMRRKYPDPRKKAARELPTLAEKIASYENHIKRGECYSVDRGKWVPESDIGNDRVVWAIDKLKELRKDVV